MYTTPSMHCSFCCPNAARAPHSTAASAAPRLPAAQTLPLRAHAAPPPAEPRADPRTDYAAAAAAAAAAAPGYAAAPRAAASPSGPMPRTEAGATARRAQGK